MVPRIGERGYSFAGSAKYYLRDKGSKTNERVIWTYTHNLPTQDAPKGFRYMAFTAMNAERLKHQAGIPATGRKSSKRTVYHFSLAWAPDQTPEKQTMIDAALTTLSLLRLSEHECVMVAHNDTAHPHVHLICNLVHPETGRMAVPCYDRLTLSAWAEEFERNEGKIRCEERPINNARRGNKLSIEDKVKIIKHRVPKLDIAPQIQQLFQSSDSGKAFQAALQSEGYTLAKGDRRSYVLFDQNGKVYSLSRQLKGLSGGAAKELFQDLFHLPDVKQVSELRKQQFLAAEKEKADKAKDDKSHNPNKDSEEFLRKLDELREWEGKLNWAKNKKEYELSQFLKRDEVLKGINDLESQLSAKPSMMSKLSGKAKKQQEELLSLKEALKSIDERIERETREVETKFLKSKPSQDASFKEKEDDYNRRIDEHLKKRGNRDKDSDLER